MIIPKLTIKLLQNDLEFVSSKGSFDGMIVKANLESLRACNPGETIESLITDALALYKHDGKQCFSEEDRPRLKELLQSILEEIEKVTTE